MANEKPFLSSDSKFHFSCHPGLSCFTHCCRDVNIYLSPFDVLRMRKRLGLSSGEFLDRYTVSLIGEGTGLPVVLLKMDEEQDKKCPFVTPRGCKIYEDRPWACRMFPLDRCSEYDQFTILTDPSRCRGLEEPQELYVEDYLREQGLFIYEDVEAIFKLLSNSPRVLNEKVANPRIIQMYYMACYDLDKFRQFIFESRFLDVFEVEPEVVERIKTDDLELLQFGFRWLQFGMVMGDALKIKEEALQEAKRKQAAREG
ncbi:YkgJ family cysteine cluster protein [Desulfofundulus sp. TPOSR]|jgi:hypothetical protein|uniref:YkgJ family cysteine cluster protein n=1 Tax=Desulfofundulus sp. TPOSR TaxID=2714340 RepID=UPI00140E00E1|nr:YkgJ family cysteine cluster protein [Desulfofundulus sp. TPOSR]NHM28383.1 YkgJ family cysteine cluster protein [Desulfofundulus sp. TPOSR]QSS05780.1 YkgJ family cysteine cluster protein [Klebsiella pneumoniae]